MGSSRVGTVRLNAHAMSRAIEAALLGRANPSARRAVEEAIAICGGGEWCDRCGASLDRLKWGVQGRSGHEGGCTECAGAGRFDGFVRLGCYEPPLDRLVRRAKRRGMHDVAHELGVRLGLELLRRHPRVGHGALVVPVPGNLWRRLTRGIDHAHVIAHGIASSVDGRVLQALRMCSGARQAGMDRENRIGRRPRFVARAAAAKALAGRPVVLVDDIRTTGSTLREARELLIGAGAERVLAAVACVTDRRQASVLQGFM